MAPTHPYTGSLTLAFASYTMLLTASPLWCSGNSYTTYHLNSFLFFFTKFTLLIIKYTQITTNWPKKLRSTYTDNITVTFTAFYCSSLYHMLEHYFHSLFCSLISFLFLFPPYYITYIISISVHFCRNLFWKFVFFIFKIFNLSSVLTFLTKSILNYLIIFF